MKPVFNLRRYHHKVFFPSNTKEMLIDFINQIVKIDITNHAMIELSTDRRGIVPIPTKEEMFHSDNTLVEFYERLDNDNNPEGIIQKVLVRVHNLSSRLDYSYVLAREGFIVSGWANAKGDDHRLNNSHHQYFQPVMA